LPITKVVFHVVNNGYELVQIPVFIPTEQRLYHLRVVAESSSGFMTCGPARCGRIIKARWVGNGNGACRPAAATLLLYGPVLD
jgi:hypothetical protein